LKAENAIVRPGGRRRQMTGVAVPEDDFMIEPEYYAQPTRYVREAQLGLVDGTYDEAWAIYDQDGHAEHPEALALAADPVHAVHIGYSGIAFEHWLLLHFEYSETAFVKSQCRHQKTIFNCGQHTHEQDCHGTRCVSGYMKEKGYVDPAKDIKTIGYAELSHLKDNALRNAFKLRRTQLTASPGLPIYAINPITTADRLVLKLLKEPMDLLWHYAQPVVKDHITFSSQVQEQQLNLSIQNNANAGFIFHLGDFILLDVTGNSIVILGRFVVEPETNINKQIELSGFEDFEPVYIGFKLEADRYAVLAL
jgi:hypothetical protein